MKSYVKKLKCKDKFLQKSFFHGQRGLYGNEHLFVVAGEHAVYMGGFRILCEETYNGDDYEACKHDDRGENEADPNGGLGGLFPVQTVH